MKYLRDALICLLLALACLSLYKLTRLEDEAMATLTDTRRVVLSLGGISANVRQVTETVRKNSDTEVKLAIEASQQTNADLIALHDVLLRADGAIRNLDGAATAVQTNLNSIGSATTAQIEALAPILDNARQGTANLVAITSPEVWQPIEQDLQMTSHDAAVMAQHGASISANADAISGDLKIYTHRVTRPASKVSIIAHLILDASPLLAHALP